MLPEGHEGDHIYTLWSEIAIHAEAAAQRVRELHKINPHACEHCGPFCEECGHEYPCATILTLDGGAE